MTFIRLPFESVFADESGGNIKTPQSEYKIEGKFPVVDQGKALVGGYTDDHNRLCGQGRPAIVFGDHTRCVKYIDFPFCMGADGVKILRPKIESSLKYLYYFLQSLDLPAAGYDRHFKYLKRTEIILPPLPEQRRIAAILDQADALRAKRREALAQLDSLTQSIFIEMFGDPTTNPNKFEVHSLGAICDVRDGTHDSPKYISSGFPLVTTKNLRDGVIDFTDVNLISESDYIAINKRSKVDKGDILMPMIGTIGSPILVCIEPNFAIKNMALIKFTKDSPHSQFILSFLKSDAFEKLIVSESKGGTQKFLSLGAIRGLQIPLPSHSLQQRFATSMAAVQLQTNRTLDSMSAMEILFASLQHRAFRGEL